MTMKRLFGFGINTFANPMSNLSGCVNDTANVRRFCVDSLNVDPREIRLLCDARATRLNIFKRLDWCARGWGVPGDKLSPEHDQLIIQMSCHGSQVVDRNGDEVTDMQDEVICPYDYPDLWDSPGSGVDVEDCALFLGQMPSPQICDDDIATFLKRIPVGVYTVIIVDACHSGSMTRTLTPAPAVTKAVSPPLDLLSRGLDRALRTRKFGVKPGSVIRDIGNNDVIFMEQNHILISGCRDNQTSADATISGMPQGAMTWALLESFKALGFGKSSQNPTWVDIHGHMVNLLKNSGFSQVPQLSGPENWLKEPAFFV